MAHTVLPPIPIVETLRLFRDCLFAAAMLVLAAVPFVIIGYEHWKERAR